MEVDELEVVQLELKYCERCGGLWLRVCGTQEVYCVSCAVQVSELPRRRRGASKPRLPVNHKVEGPGRAAGLAVCGEGGNA